MYARPNLMPWVNTLREDVPAGYESANRHLLELAEAHPDRLRTLARVDPADDPLGEAERCLDAAAVGLKLHPRGEGFDIADRASTTVSSSPTSVAFR